MSKFTERAQRKKIVAKIVMLGDGAVGKTALVRRFMKQSFDGAYKITMGLDLSLKEINLPETTVGIQLWDMGGQVAFRSLRSRFYQGSRCAVLVYDVTRPQTFENLDEWRQELKENIQEEIPFVILGNKNDLQDLILVSEEDERNWAEKANALAHFRSSAKTGENVEETFQLIAVKITEDLRRMEEQQKRVPKKEPRRVNFRF